MTTAIRSFVFNIAFGLISVFFVSWAALAALRPKGARVRWVVGRYVRAMTWAMRAIAGIRIEVRGRERLPKGGFILAPKHASYGDGFSVYSQFDDLAFVTGDHLERFPLMKTVLQKLGAIVVKSCGGPEVRGGFNETAAAAAAQGRRILIYPEGHLAPVGVYFRYRAGVYHMAREFGLPVVPVASNLGLFWSQEEWAKRAGVATLEFLEPIDASGLSKPEFLAALTRVVEGRTAELVAQARGGEVVPAVLGEPGRPRPQASPPELQHA